jgi:hypothetical protein
MEPSFAAAGAYNDFSHSTTWPRAISEVVRWVARTET